MWILLYVARISFRSENGPHKVIIHTQFFFQWRKFDEVILNGKKLGKKYQIFPLLWDKYSGACLGTIPPTACGPYPPCKLTGGGGGVDFGQKYIFFN